MHWMSECFRVAPCYPLIVKFFSFRKRFKFLSYYMYISPPPLSPLSPLPLSPSLPSLLPHPPSSLHLLDPPRLSAFLVRLRTSGSIVKNLGDILHSQIPLLTPHIRWCSCQLTACTLLQSKSSDPLFKEFEQKCAQDPRAAGLPLSSFLLKPMQRITKYPLLIQRVYIHVHVHAYAVEGRVNYIHGGLLVRLWMLQYSLFHPHF